MHKKWSDEEGYDLRNLTLKVIPMTMMVIQGQGRHKLKLLMVLIRGGLGGFHSRKKDGGGH